jgi:hypothetical protein
MECGVLCLLILSRMSILTILVLTGIKTFDYRNSQYKESENGLSNIFEIPDESRSIVP